MEGSIALEPRKLIIGGIGFKENSGIWK